MTSHADVTDGLIPSDNGMLGEWLVFARFAWPSSPIVEHLEFLCARDGKLVGCGFSTLEFFTYCLSFNCSALNDHERCCFWEDPQWPSA